LKKVNSQRPQTSYGGLSERQKNLQLSLRQISSKLENKRKKEEEANNNTNNKIKKSKVSMEIMK